MSDRIGDKAKKRRTDDGSKPLSTEQEREDESRMAHELSAIKSAMNELLDHSRHDMASMRDEVKNMHSEMKCMRDDIKYLRGKCDLMDKSVQTKKKNDPDPDLTEMVSNLRETVDSRFEEVENRQKYHEVMLKNQKWEYAAPLPSEGSVNWGTKSLIDDIKKYTCSMRYGNYNELIQLVGTGSYNEVSLPHWEEFWNALKEHQYALKCLPNELEQSFHLHGMQLPDHIFNGLSNALQSTHFKKFTLTVNNLTREGIKMALDYMKHNPILREFSLASNPINHIDDVSELCEIIKTHPSIETVCLDACFGEGINGYELLCSILDAGTSKLKSIEFSDNELRSNGSTILSELLASNPRLERLTVENNILNDEDAASIARALKRNSNLQFINLVGSNISYLGWQTLSKTELDNSSLNSAADSNHTCYILNEYGNEVNGDPEQDNDMPYLRTALRSKKIYSILSCRNKNWSNVQHLDDVPLEFLPDILQSIQKYSEYHLGDNTPGRDEEDSKSLSIVFEIMRRWDNALSVYEALSISNAEKS